MLLFFGMFGNAFHTLRCCIVSGFGTRPVWSEPRQLNCADSGDVRTLRKRLNFIATRQYSADVEAVEGAETYLLCSCTCFERDNELAVVAWLDGLQHSDGLGETVIRYSRDRREETHFEPVVQRLLVFR